MQAFFLTIFGGAARAVSGRLRVGRDAPYENLRRTRAAGSIFNGTMLFAAICPDGILAKSDMPMFTGKECPNMPFYKVKKTINYTCTADQLIRFAFDFDEGRLIGGESSRFL